MTDSTPAAYRAQREQPEALRARSLGVSLTVNDIQASAAWYRDVLGCTVDRWMERDGKVASAVILVGDVRILLNQDDGAKGANRPKGEGFSMMLSTTQNVDEIAARIREAGGKLDTEPADMPWGARVFRVTDPSGYKFAISAPLTTA